MSHDRNQDQRNHTDHNHLTEATMKRLSVFMAAMAALIFILLSNNAWGEDFDITQNFNYKLLKNAHNKADRTRYMMGALRACGSGYVDIEDPKMAECKAKVKVLYNSLGSAKGGGSDGRSKTPTPKGVPCHTLGKYVEKRTDECSCPDGHIEGETEMKGVKTPICIKCPLETPLVEKGGCIACPSDKPKWTGSECITCDPNELWVKEEGKPGNCVACEEPTPFAQKKADHTGVCKNCFELDPDKPKWDEETLSCIACPDGQYWLNPTPRCVSCTPGVSVWNPVLHMCRAIPMTVCGKTSIKVPEGKSCPRWDPVMFRWDYKLKDDGRCKGLAEYSTDSPDQPFGCSEERHREAMKKQGYMVLLVHKGYKPPSKVEVYCGELWWLLFLVIFLMAVVIVILILKIRSNKPDDDDYDAPYFPPPRRGQPDDGVINLSPSQSDTALSSEQAAQDFFTAGEKMGREKDEESATAVPTGPSLIDDEEEGDVEDQPSSEGEPPAEDPFSVPPPTTQKPPAPTSAPSPEELLPSEPSLPAGRWNAPGMTDLLERTSPPADEPLPPETPEKVELLTNGRPHGRKATLPPPSGLQRVATPVPPKPPVSVSVSSVTTGRSGWDLIASSATPPPPTGPPPQELTKTGGFEAPDQPAASVPTELGYSSPSVPPSESTLPGQGGAEPLSPFSSDGSTVMGTAPVDGSPPTPPTGPPSQELTRTGGFEAPDQPTASVPTELGHASHAPPPVPPEPDDGFDEFTPNEAPADDIPVHVDPDGVADISMRMLDENSLEIPPEMSPVPPPHPPSPIPLLSDDEANARLRALSGVLSGGPRFVRHTAPGTGQPPPIPPPDSRTSGEFDPHKALTQPGGAMPFLPSPPPGMPPAPTGRMTSPQTPSAKTRLGFAGGIPEEDIVTQPETPDGKPTTPHRTVLGRPPLPSAMPEATLADLAEEAVQPTSAVGNGMEDTSPGVQAPIPEPRNYPPGQPLPHRTLWLTPSSLEDEPEPGVKASGDEDMVQGGFSSPPPSNGSMPPRAQGVIPSDTFMGQAHHLGIPVEHFAPPADSSHERDLTRDELDEHLGDADEEPPDDPPPSEKGGFWGRFRRKK